MVKANFVILPIMKTNKTIKFLLISSKNTLSKEDISYLVEYLNNREISDEQIINIAQNHAIVSVVYQNLREHFADDTLVVKLKQKYMINAQKSMLISAELLRVVGILEGHNIEAISFKGSSLSMLLYRDVISRQYSDIDILIEYEDIEKIYDILSQNGYEKTLNIAPNQEQKWYKNSKDMAFFHTTKGIHIEFHWLLVDRDFPIEFDIKSYQNITINRQIIKTFANEDLLIYLTIHGSTHLWHSIGWIRDIDMMIKSQNIDWDIIKSRLNSTNRGAFLLGLYLSYRLLNTPIPNYYKERINDNSIEALAKFIIKSWQESVSEFKIRVGIVYILPDIKTRVKYLYKVVIKPSRSEYAFIDLPKGLYWVYYLIRPYLLLKKYLF